MFSSIKAMVVIVTVALLVFRVVKPIAITFSDPSDFARRQHVWFALTITGFLSPSFWLFAAVAVPLLLWAGRKDHNPVALYIFLLHVIPPIQVEIPAIAINKVFALDMYRLLSLFVLFPAMRRPRTAGLGQRTHGINLMDLLLLAYGAIQILFFARPDTPDAMQLHDSLTNMLRRGFLYFIDVYLIYFVTSRSCTDRRTIAEVLAAFVISCLVLAPLALLETLRNWLLFSELGKGWGGNIMGQYLQRGGSLRAILTAGHSLALGYLFAIAFGFWLYLRNFATARRGITSLLLLGLFAAYSRGPWLGALVIYFVFVTLSPRAIPRLIKAAVLFALITLVVVASPVGDRVVKVIPFLGGKVDAENVDYRQRLAQRSWDSIKQNPWFGDQNAYSKLNDLRQGGIIDFVNVYASVTVFYGTVGLLAFLSFILVGLFKCCRIARERQSSDSDFARLGVTLAACIIGTLVMIASSSFIFGYVILFYTLGGLAAAYSFANRAEPVSLVRV